MFINLLYISVPVYLLLINGVLTISWLLQTKKNVLYTN